MLQKYGRGLSASLQTIAGESASVSSPLRFSIVAAKNVSEQTSLFPFPVFSDPLCRASSKKILLKAWRLPLSGLVFHGGKKRHSVAGKQSKLIRSSQPESRRQLPHHGGSRIRELAGRSNRLTRNALLIPG